MTHTFVSSIDATTTNPTTGDILRSFLEHNILNVAVFLMVGAAALVIEFLKRVFFYVGLGDLTHVAFRIMECVVAIGDVVGFVFFEGVIVYALIRKLLRR